MYNNKKLLVLAGVGPHSKVVETANKMGIYTIVTDYLDESPAKKIANKALQYNISDVEELVMYCKANEVSGVIDFCVDPAQKPAQEIAERCGLPTFGTSKQVFALTNKKAFKKLCVDTGVDIIPEYCEEDIISDKIVYPVLVKPVDSRGSRGCFVCENKAELIKVLPISKSESSDNSVIIERYMENNQDLTISYIVKNGVPTLVSVGDRFSGKKEDNLNRQLICTIQPSRFIEMYMKYVDKNVKNMIKYLGIKNGPVFMQGFVDGNTVRMYDPGIRFPGNEYERIVKAATGVDLMKSLISYAVGGEVDDNNGRLAECYDLEGKCAIQYMLNIDAGEVAKFEGLEEISNHTNIIDVQQRHFIGAIIEKTGDIRHRAGEISILVERNSEKMAQMIEYVQSKIKVENTHGKSMIISPINSNFVRKLYK